MGCYGDPLAQTPNVDALAARGLRYARCWSSAPVCAPARTTIITGVYPTSLGAEQMRSMVRIPAEMELFPRLLRKRGYYCTNNSKEDYNVPKRGQVWDESSRRAHWKNRGEGQPFFAVFNATDSHESAIRRFEGDPEHDPQEVRVPAYHPDTPTSRRDWAIYYDSVTRADAKAGERLRELEAAGLADSTIVFYWGDHGSGMPRSKRWPCNSGLHVPLIVHIPEAFAHLRPPEYEAGGVSERLVAFIDFAPTMLSLAGIEPPAWMQGHAFLGEYISDPPRYLHGFRGRMDERLDLVRSVTDGRYVYLRNYMPHRSQGQHVSYQFETPTTAEWRKLYEAGKTNRAQSIFWERPKAAEELYDLRSDRDEVVNLAGSAAHKETLERMRRAQQSHAAEIIDVGFVPEGMRFELAGDQSFYSWARSSGGYDFAAVCEAAEQASRVELATAAEVASGLGSKDPAVRYWAAIGLLVRGEAAVAEHAVALRDRLGDDFPEVRVTAARALMRHAGGARERAALEQLVADADARTAGVFGAVLALDALGAYEGSLQSFAEAIETLPEQGDSPHGRYNSYVPRLLSDLRAKLARRSP
jgi:uncharacterized sulfatase